MRRNIITAILAVFALFTLAHCNSVRPEPTPEQELEQVREDLQKRYKTEQLTFEQLDDARAKLELSAKLHPEAIGDYGKLNCHINELKAEIAGGNFEKWRDIYLHTEDTELCREVHVHAEQMYTMFAGSLGERFISMRDQWQKWMPEPESYTATIDWVLDGYPREPEMVPLLCTFVDLNKIVNAWDTDEYYLWEWSQRKYTQLRDYLKDAGGVTVHTPGYQNCAYLLGRE